jgi:uncharacterized protein YndB with AHSA1/START domain
MSTKDELNQQHLEIKKTITIDASPEVIFKALTNIDDLHKMEKDR